MNNSILRCPICAEPLTLGERSWCCENRHSFDVARQGYVNLLPVQQKHSKNPGDTRDMVAARRSFLDQGHYLPIAQAVERILAPTIPKEGAILDAGCGEGYYLSCLQAGLKQCGKSISCMGVDISKEAVRFAAGRNKDIKWFAASAAHLPIIDESLDGILSMFALTVPEEFRRVLKPGACFLEVTAGRGHLMGLKRLIYSEIIEKQAKYAGDYSGFTLLSQETLEFPLELTENAQILQLLSMTPHFWRITREGSARAAEAQSLRDLAQVEFRLYCRD